MENFEYSIELSDRDWAAFAVAAAECGLALGALAEEEPALTDMEEPRVEAGPRSPRCRREEAAGPRSAGSSPSTPGASTPAVRPKTPAQARKSRKARGAGAAREPRAPVGGPGPLAPPSSTLSGTAKEKAAEVAPGKEAARRTALGPGVAEAASAGPGLRETETRDKAPKDEVAKDKVAKDDVAKDKVTKDEVAKDDVAKDEVAKDKVVKDKVTKDEVAKDEVAKDDVAKDKAAKDKVTKDEVANNDVAKDKADKDKVAQDKAVKDNVAKEKVAKDKVAKDKAVQDKAAQDKAAKDEAAECPEVPGRSGGHHTSPAALADTAAPVAACRDAPGKLPDAGATAVLAGNALAPAKAAVTPPGSAGPNTREVTWPEMYDYLFCDSQGEEEAAQSPAEEEEEEEEVPAHRAISLPELYEHFFNEPEGKRKKVQGKDRRREKRGGSDGLQREDPGSAAAEETLVISVPEVYEHFFADGPGNGDGWRGLFPRTPASEVSRAVRALKRLLRRPVHLLGGQASAPRAAAGTGSVGKLPLIPLAPPGCGRAQPGAPDMTLALTGRPAAPLVLTHKDMCLVFCAFASWAVRTSDLQAPDAWKTVFLASFGTLSAIRYFRRQLREGHPQT
ncbi:PGC-1 and ERR-induced regulator in muscle protein 1 [Nothoprocta perdicaria]|nr:PGC-1 and ERR-induced regulator in muscle protein 1 [Nothoprocta perdicaria]